jgi:hypothetical protein
VTPSFTPTRTPRDKSPANLRKGSRALAQVLPNAQLRVLEGVRHALKVKLLAPLLEQFLAVNDPDAEGEQNRSTIAA